MLSTFSCAFWLFISLLWRNVKFIIRLVFLDIELHELCILRLIPVSRVICKSFSHFISCLYVLFTVSFTVQKAFKFNQPPFVYFHFHHSRRWIQKDSAGSVVRVSVYIFLLFIGTVSFLLCLVLENVLISLLHMCLSSLPSTITEETVFSLLYILASSVKDKCPSEWVYLWAFFPVSLLIYISALVS